MSEVRPIAEKDACRCQVVGSSRDPYEPHIPAQAEWEQADDCPVHPLLPSAVASFPCRCLFPRLRVEPDVPDALLCERCGRWSPDA